QASGRNLSGAQTGPVVRVIRGTQASEVPAGTASDPEDFISSANGLISTQADGLRNAGSTVPAASATLIK
ncbi:MAG: hypothetical protein AAFY47_05255, partial [Pseudomonadota bacterium]